MSRVQANGIEIEYEIGGSGDPLLLVMGLGGQLIDWPQSFIDLLEERFQVIRFDNRDVGLSTEFEWEPPTRAQTMRSLLTRRPPPADYSITDMATDTVGLLDALNINSAHVMGMSMGGMIAQAVAIDHPDRVRSLTSVMSNTGDHRSGRPSKRLLAKMARLGVPTVENAAELGTEMFSLFAGPTWNRDEHLAMAQAATERSFRPLGTARQMAAIAASPDRTSGLATVTAPTLVIHGIVDRLVKPSGGIATCGAVPGSRLLMYPDMGHDLPAPRRREMVAAIAMNAAAAPAHTSGAPS
ncbi:MAG: alpha/beta hydrolase [Actinomycetia bacterium]|nr:alpha/beta hydrolase [Actinomycetes bacterium]MCP4960079.1 alpha/beta hydrolase [Actinomycetes bacterium]